MIIMSRRRFILCMLWPFFLLAAIAAASPLWFPQMGYYLVVSDPLEKSDAIAVLGGGDMQRIVVTEKLYGEKWAPLIVTTGAVIPDYIEAVAGRLTYAELAARLLVEKGVPKKRIIILNKATSTFEEALAIKKLARKENFKRIIVVTSIYHTRRTRLVYKKIFENSGVEIIVRAAKGGKFTTDKWWTREDDVVFVNSEWVKLGLYFITGKI